MQKKMEVGLRHTSTLIISEKHTAETLGSGDMPVLATPIMVALMENAAMLAVKDTLPEGSTTVGGHIDVSHLRPNGIGQEVAATAELQEIEGKKLTFHVVATQGENVIGEGTHVRFIVDRERFMAKV